MSKSITINGTDYILYVRTGELFRLRHLEVDWHASECSNPGWADQRYQACGLSNINGPDWVKLEK